MRTPKCEICKKEVKYPYYCRVCLEYECFDCLQMCVARQHGVLTSVNFVCKLCNKRKTHDNHTTEPDTCSECEFFLL